MQRTVTIHAGLPKCGSTALQFILASNREKLLADGVCYPTSDEGGVGHMPLCNDMIAAGKREGASPMLARMRQEFDASGATRLILSSEGFAVRSRKFRATAIGDLLDGLAVEVVVFTRRRDEWVRSFYKQSVKNTSRRYGDTLGAFVAEPPSFAARLDGGYVADAIKRFADLVKAARVEIVSLDVEKVGTPELLGRIVGLPLGAYVGSAGVLNGRKAIQFASGQRINVAFSDVDTMFIAACNTLDEKKGWHRQIRLALSELDTSEIAPNFRILSPELSQRLLADGAEDDRRLAATFGTPVVDYPPLVAHDGAQYRQRLTAAEFDAVREALLATLPDDAAKALRRAPRPKEIVAG